MMASERRQTLDREQLAKNAKPLAQRPELRASLSRLLRAATHLVVFGPALAGPAHAQTQPQSAPAGAPTDTTSQQVEDPQDIVVVAERSEQSSIDRTTYIVKDNAQARASSALDLLGRVPTVDVSPSGQVRLIGRSGVTIQVDGQAVPNANDFLRAMQGAQVAKIEVVTNPSAQFSARGTGGIINIITRRSSGAGLGGSMTGSVGSFGSYEIRSSPTWSQGKLSLSGSIGVRREGSKGESEEERLGVEPGEETSRFEVQRSRGDTDQLITSLRATVEIAPKQTVSINVLGIKSEGEGFAKSKIVEGDNPLEERSSVTTDADIRRIVADYRREGSRSGEQTSISVSHTAIRLGMNRRFLTSATEGSSAFRALSELTGDDTVVKVDHVRPAGNRRLAFGGQFQRSAEDNRQQVTTISAPANPLALDESFAGAWSEAAAYVTYQLPLGGTTLLAGARVESRWYAIADVSDDPAGSTHLFPSLHIERELKKWLTANLSYSSRIGWTSLALLDPRLRFSDPTTARAGNPLLRPEKTHSLELKLMAKAGKHEADLTSYYQRTRDLSSSLAELEGEVLVSRPVNLGTSASLGTSLVVRGPLARRLCYTATAYLACETIEDSALDGIDDSGTRYGASLQLDYRDGIEGRAGADQIRLAARYTGPSDFGLSSTSATVRADASWSHAITDRLSTVLTASHVLKSPKSIFFGPDVISRSFSHSSGPTINLALTYGLSPSGQ